MTKLHFESPDGSTQISSPTAQQMADIILHSDAGYWQRGGNGQAVISIGSMPVMSFTCPVEDAFFIETYLDDRCVIYDRSGRQEHVVSELGGDPFRIPLACLVTPHVAAQVASQFVQTQQLPTCVHWVPMGDVPFDVGWYDE